MSSAMRSGSCSGTSSAEIEIEMFLVRPKMAPAMISGEGLQPLKAPWCSSSESMPPPSSSSAWAMSSMAL